MDLLSFRIVNEIEALLTRKDMTPAVFNDVMADLKFEVHGYVNQTLSRLQRCCSHSSYSGAMAWCIL
jgi:hypothetical protein